MYCPNCGVNNDQDAKFCMNCGNPLDAPAVSVNRAQDQPTIKQEQPVYPPSQQTQHPYNFPTPPTFPLYQTREGTSLVNVWNPFAGYGTQHTHQGWLMDNKGEKADELIGKVRAKFSDRSIPEAHTEEREMTAKGVIVEKRPYFLLGRRLVTIGLYITQFGKDLFVSIVSYLKPPISNLRVILVVLMLLFALYTLFFFPGALESKLGGILGGGLFGGSRSSSSGLASLICILGPLGTFNILLLGILLIYSLYKWFSEKDFFAALRMQPNEFNKDDLMAMEKAVEQTVRVAMDEIGLDPDDLKPIKTGDERRLI